MRQILTEGFSELGLSLSEESLSRFQQYYSFLTERGRVMNLTAISGEEATARLHFLDCAALLSQYNFAGASVIDVGSGAGFPGIPLKLAQPDISLTLLDSQQKRVGFLRETCALLGLDDVSCTAGRAEDAARENRGCFDIAVSRAVARLNILCELCLPFVRIGGAFIAMKGPDCEAEAIKAAALLGGGRSELKQYTIPGTDIVHSAVIIHKLAPTPPQYPRQFGIIKKKPL